MKKHLAAMLILLLLVGCKSVVPTSGEEMPQLTEEEEIFAKVEVGMTYEDVCRIMGKEPFSETPQSIYMGVPVIEEIPPKRWKYRVLFKNGKVYRKDSFKEFRQQDGSAPSGTGQ